MKLRLAAIHPAQIEPVRLLSDAETTRYLAAIQSLRDHESGEALLEMVRRNHNEFEASIGSAGTHLPAPGQRGALQRELSLELNRRFLNFLTSFRQFLDHTEARLKRRYAAAPHVAAAFKQRTGVAYDDHFAYRFLYRLRNFGQHLGMPIGYVDIESKALQRTGGLVLHQVHLRFDREQLLAGGDSIWGKAGVQKELAALAERFAVEPYPRVVVAELGAIWDDVRAAERPVLEAVAADVVEITEGAAHARITPAVMREHRRSGSTQFEFIMPPIPVMAWLGHRRFREFL